MLMPDTWIELYMALPAFLLVLFRIAGLMLASPLFSSPAIPLQFKALLALAVSMALFPAVGHALPEKVTLASALTGLVGEVFIGAGGCGLVLVVHFGGRHDGCVGVSGFRCPGFPVV